MINFSKDNDDEEIETDKKVNRTKKRMIKKPVKIESSMGKFIHISSSSSSSMQRCENQSKIDAFQII